MKSMRNYLLWVYVGSLLASLATGIIFFKLVVGYSGTNIFSVIFGWQWIYLAIISVIILILACIKKSKNIAIVAGIILTSLAIVLVPARLVESSRIYITGDGGPSGPRFSCLVWERSAVSLRNGSYQDNLGLCTLMSIPSYNKFLIDRREKADRTDSSITYYAMFAVNELVLIGGGWFAYKKLLKRKAIVHEKAVT